MCFLFMNWIFTRIDAEIEFMKKIIKRKSKLLIKKGKIMSDSDYQAGMTAAIVAYQASLSGAYPTTGFSYSYTPPVTAVPPAETVQVTF